MEKINKLFKAKCGVYCITNLINGHRYIGSSVNLYDRLFEHVCCLNGQRAHNQHLQSAWNKYGADAFSYAILEYCSPDIRFEREQDYINFIHPEYNLTENVIANTGHPCSEETKQKISTTLKSRYAAKEITTYDNQQAWIKCYIYDIYSYKLIKVCKNIREASEFLYKKKNGKREASLFKTVIGDRYCILREPLYGLDLVNYIDKNFKYYASHSGIKYLIAEEISTGILTYYRTTKECGRGLLISGSMIMKNLQATKDNPYISNKASNYKVYFVSDFIEHAVLSKELAELLSGNIGEEPEKENPEINLESNESKSSYSVEGETL